MMFKPKIIGFVCNWSQPTTLNSAGTGRIWGYPRIRFVRVMCIGRIDPVAVLETFAKGADGVLLIGCHPPDCHYVEGNLQTEYTVEILKKLIPLAGLEPERVKLLWYSPSEKQSFGQHVKDFYEQVKNFGPSPLRNEQPQSKLMLNILATKNVASDFRLRVLLGREKELTEGVNVYGEHIPKEELDATFDDIIREEFVRHMFYLLTKTKPFSVKELAETVGMKPAAVLRQIVNMRRRNMIILDHVEGTTPFYKALEVK
ncbi:hydrogenase iron-sulfur subunit [Candidatus Bathyarchaeota archaeon]|nr:hydrogenase iron-sulfur subunit [Candidatus Bathyarchaeota archaeon]